MPEAKVVRKNPKYCVDAASSVRLKVTVGDTQAGGGSVMWGKKHQRVLPDKAVTIQGEGSLAGSTARLVMVVKDVATAHDHTSITVTLTGGPPQDPFIYREDADAQQGEVVYIVTISFV